MAVHVEKKKKMMMEKLKEIPSEIVFEILTWLPVKALDRFKCVSKSWSSIILQPEFVKSHRPSGCILLNIDNSMKKGLFYASINIRGDSLPHEQIQDLKTETFVQRLRMPYFGYENITPVLNGLACLYKGNQVSLFNIFTCEIMEIFPSRIYIEGPRIWYALGFDPVDNVYKLLKVSSQLDYKILTLNPSSKSTWKWRTIDVPHIVSIISVKDQRYFVNGLIFWKCCDWREEFIIAFDVHKENFTTINPPPSLRIRRLGQFEGHLALSYTHWKNPNSWVLDILVLENHQNSIWNKITIDLPAEVDKHFYMATPIGNLPSGELLFSCFGFVSVIMEMDHLFYTYDPIKKIFTKLMIELPAYVDRLCPYPVDRMSCLFGKITTLDDLLGFRKKLIKDD